MGRARQREAFPNCAGARTHQRTLPLEHRRTMGDGRPLEGRDAAACTALIQHVGGSNSAQDLAVGCLSARREPGHSRPLPDQVHGLAGRATRKAGTRTGAGVSSLLATHRHRCKLGRTRLTSQHRKHRAEPRFQSSSKSPRSGRAARCTRTRTRTTCARARVSTPRPQSLRTRDPREPAHGWPAGRMPRASRIRLPPAPWAHQGPQ